MPILPDGTELPYNNPAMAPPTGDPGFEAELQRELAGDQQQQGGVEDHIRTILDSARLAVVADDGQITESERLFVEKITTLAQQFLAQREKEQQAALGGGPATNFLRRSG